MTNQLQSTIEGRLEEEEIRLSLFRRAFPAHIQLLQCAARGELSRTEADAVEQAIDAVVGFLKRSLGLGERNFPDDFYENAETCEIARLISYAQMWLYGDDLIDFPEAAEILRNDVSRDSYSRNNAARVYMNSKIRPKEGTPELTLYWNPDARYQRRVRRSEVIALSKRLSR